MIFTHVHMPVISLPRWFQSHPPPPQNQAASQNIWLSAVFLAAVSCAFWFQAALFIYTATYIYL